MNWHRNCRRLWRKYRAELAIERARTEATREALRLMIQELASALDGSIEVLDAGWQDESGGSN